MNVLRKTLAPTLPREFLHRERLSQVLSAALRSGEDEADEAHYRLVLLCAPAGYGKTMLLADTMKRLSLPCCWVLLEREDQHLPHFLSTLFASLRQLFPAAADRLDALLQQNSLQDDASLTIILDMLLEILATVSSSSWIINLCNYQEVNTSSRIQHFLNQLLKGLPASCTLIIESRVMPDLELAAFIVYRQMFGLSARDLSFTPEDVYALAQLKGLSGFSTQDAEHLADTFGGWITGMLLASPLGSSSFEAFPSALRPASMSPLADRKHLLAFVSGVFQNEPAIYAVLRQTSLLEELAPDFCDVLLHTSETAALLERAEQLGLFISSTIEDDARIYRCHVLVRQLLLEDMRQQQPQCLRALYQRAARLYYEAHNYQAALTYALQAHDSDVVAEILLEVSQPLLEQGQSELILSALDSLPLSVRERHPRLLLIQANIYLRRGDAASARNCFEQAQHLVPLLASADQLLTRTELALVRGKLLLQQGDYLVAWQTFHDVLEGLPGDERKLRLEAHQQCGICSILSGRPIHEGILHFRQALKLCHAQWEVGIVAELHHQLATAYTWSGNYPVAEHHRSYLRTLLERSQQSQKIMNNRIGLGVLKLRQGLVEEARLAFQETLELTQQTPRFASSYAYALVGLGQVALATHNLSHALGHLQEALDIAHQLEDRYLLNDTLGMLALTYLRCNDTYTARSLLEQMILQNNEVVGYESLFRQLVDGTILLAEQRYDEAVHTLEDVSQQAGKSGIQWVQVQALLRFAACRKVQGLRAGLREAVERIRELNAQGYHDFTIQIELQTYPLLQSIFDEKQEPEESAPVISAAPSERLRIRAFGEPTILLDDRALTSWGRARALELFFYLLDQTQPLRKDRIVATLWPEAEEDETLGRIFRSTVYSIRQTLGDASLTHQAGLYQLNLQALYGQIWYDVALFEAQERTARAALAQEDDEEAAEACAKMIELYQGKYVEAFYSDWCNKRRDLLHQSMLEARRQLALIAWRREAWEESLLHWQQLLLLDPFLETAHYNVMRCYSRMGKRDLALRQYQRCSKDLYEQLGAEPGPLIQKLYQRLSSPQGR